MEYLMAHFLIKKKPHKKVQIYTTKNTERFLIAQAEQSASINGLLGNGTAEYIGRYVF